MLNITILPQPSSSISQQVSSVPAPTRLYTQKSSAHSRAPAALTSSPLGSNLHLLLSLRGTTVSTHLEENLALLLSGHSTLLCQQPQKGALLPFKWHLLQKGATANGIIHLSPFQIARSNY